MADIFNYETEFVAGHSGTETESVAGHTKTETEFVAVGDTRQKRVFSLNIDEVYFSEHSSEEDSDYHEEIGSDEDSEADDAMLEPEYMGMANKCEFLPEFNKFI